MDYLPGNPWTYDKDEIRLENIRKLRVMKYIQWKNAESEINSIISTYNNKGYNIWDLCDNRFKFIFNHRTNRFILDNDLNRNRIRNLHKKSYDYGRKNIKKKANSLSR